MPLSKKKNRDRMRIARATYVQPNTVQPTRSIGGLIMEGNKIIGVQPKPVQPAVPLYNPSVHRTGDTVRMLKGEVIVTIPELDAEGNPIPEFT